MTTYPSVHFCARCGDLETAHELRTDGVTRGKRLGQTATSTSNVLCAGWEPGRSEERPPESVLRERLAAAEARLAGVRGAAVWLGDVLATSARDWAESRDLALVYGVVLGWFDPDDPDDVAEGDGALRQIAALFPADSKAVERMQEHRAAVRALVARGES